MHKISFELYNLSKVLAWIVKKIKLALFFGSPDYSPAHLIFKKTGIDVVSFGQAGAGSFDGIWSEPITQFLHINSTKNYRLLPPEYFLIFFYEGNDIYDNIQFVNENLKPAFIQTDGDPHLGHARGPARIQHIGHILEWALRVSTYQHSKILILLLNYGQFLDQLFQ